MEHRERRAAPDPRARRPPQRTDPHSGLDRERLARSRHGCRLAAPYRAGPIGYDADVHVLLIEDDPTIADFVARGLRESGFAVDTAADGQSGLALALAQPFDVAIIDLMLPKMDGLAVIDALRRRGRSIPVLILSAKRSVDDRVRGLQAGGDDYLTKPFAFAELLARGAARPGAGTGAAGDAHPRADLADRRRLDARPAVAESDARRHRD
jgi:CheY-like chemotaxis protein